MKQKEAETSEAETSESEATIEQILAEVGQQLEVSQETKRELLLELRCHLEDALETAVAKGEDETVAMLKVAQRFGGTEVGKALQVVHIQWESADAILACVLPVTAALLLRWLVFAPGGTAVGWEQVLIQPVFWLVAIAALVAPLLKFGRWHYALASWAFFWIITMMFALLPTAASW
jgi:hypothetical protein